MTAKAKTALWLALVISISAACYLPRLLERGGAAVPGALTGLAGFFVLVPALVTLGFLLPAGKVKAHFLENCGAISLQEGAACLGTAALGAFVALAYSLATGASLFQDAYGSIAGFAASCAYLYATAFIEELAWRAFFLKRLAAGGKKAGPLLLAGLAWAFWHIPMWTIRNGLGVGEVIPLLVWAVLVALVLGGLYLRYQNLFSTALCHMLFNVCFLAPVWCNILALLAALALLRLYPRARK